LISMTAGAVIKIICNFILVGDPDINISGAPVGTVACYSVIAAINVIAIVAVIRPPRILRCAFKPLAASAAMGISAYWIQVAAEKIMGNTLGTICAIAAGGLLYIVLIPAMGALSYDDVLLLPKGGMIAHKLKIKEKM
ncbi:MAG: polysaccharide biosynthesis C-terminal domain-containing protein, partial [Oscillospiraceae bacterium]|nr:polysaccharide biosynthesis C-terminal domain-containing protein [Oscillospiraceae bacterium]